AERRGQQCCWTQGRSASGTVARVEYRTRAESDYAGGGDDSVCGSTTAQRSLGLVGALRWLGASSALRSYARRDAPLCQLANAHSSARQPAQLLSCRAVGTHLPAGVCAYVPASVRLAGRLEQRAVL